MTHHPIADAPRLAAHWAKAWMYAYREASRAEAGSTEHFDRVQRRMEAAMRRCDALWDTANPDWVAQNSRV